MKTFKTVTPLYLDRLKRRYRKLSSRVLACPNLMKTNHLLGPCHLCADATKGLQFDRWEPVTYRNYDRIYAVRDDPWYTFCLKRLVSMGVCAYTSTEFPTPRVTYRGVTRIPMFYLPVTETVLDCFPDEESMGRFSGYFLNQMFKVCSEYGLHYVQSVMTPTEYREVVRQSRSQVVEEAVRTLLEAVTPR